MDVEIDEGVLPIGEEGEIRSVLHSLAVGGKACNWTHLPEKMRVVGRLHGGRGLCELMEARVWQDKLVVLKIGPLSALKNEYQNYERFIKGQSESNLFAPINAVTPGVLNRSKANRGREAVIYEHVASYHGATSCRTFEDVAKEAIESGGSKLEAAINALERLFPGVEKDLYRKCKVEETDESLVQFWNLRLGSDAVIEIDDLNKRGRRLEKKNIFGPVEQVYPSALITNAARVDGNIEPGMQIEVRDLTVAWWNDRLMGEHFNEESRERGEPLRIEVVTNGRRTIQELAGVLKEGSRFHVCGKVQSTRARSHRALLLNQLKKEITARDGLITGLETRIVDPFAVLPEVLKRKPARRVTSRVHGDLNPRNILIVEDGSYLRPYLIDYAFTNDSESIFADFVRLEVCLARDALPDELGWAQYVRLQRLLSAACRLGDEAAERFYHLLGQDNEKLASAFRLFRVIRSKAFEIYCNALKVPLNEATRETHREQWFREYIEQLFLFAHLTCKWPKAKDQTAQEWQAALRATAAIACVAAEGLSERDLYRWWSVKNLREEGLGIIRFIGERRAQSPLDLSGLALALEQLRLKPDDPLESEFELARMAFVKQAFKIEAKGLKADLGADHRFYISLRAYMDLKGKMNPGRGRQRHSYEEMLENDALLAASEDLRSGEGDDSALNLIAGRPAITLIGDAGSGKSTVASELMYRLALSIVGEKDPRNQNEKEYRPRLPIILQAPEISTWLKESSLEATDPRAIAAVLERESNLSSKKAVAGLITMGALYVIVDALNELNEDQRQQIAEWITTLSENYRRTPILVCHREYNYVPGLLPFPVVTLQKVNDTLARLYMHDYFSEKGVRQPGQLAERLAKLLLDDPLQENVRDLTRTPLFLMMIVDCYLTNQSLPTSRGLLFEDFCRRYLEGNYRTDQR